METLPLLLPRMATERLPGSAAPRGAGPGAARLPPAKPCPHMAANAAIAAPAPHATVHRTAESFITGGRSSAPHSHVVPAKATVVTVTATSHLPNRSNAHPRISTGPLPPNDGTRATVGWPFWLIIRIRALVRTGGRSLDEENPGPSGPGFSNGSCGTATRRDAAPPFPPWT
ncbi:hypothetical protein GCM10010103_19730 [Streptomyces paradoxus]